ncbi:hypothetical protein OIV83_000633 [Microbotryomycetes sp. JL201]|nr:hypothetical protein OIV83_000633 [Microbotryomycetes sp. JL201]
MLEYSDVSRRWQPHSHLSRAASTSISHGDDPLSLATWNVWCRAQSELGLSDEKEHFRQKSILHHLRFLGSCSFIALQEVDVQIRRLVQHESWVKRDFLVFCGVGDDGDDKQQGCMLLVRKQLYSKGSRVLWQPLRTAPHERARNARREIIGVSLFDESGKEHMRAATVHCSALPMNAPLRQDQYTKCVNLLRLDASDSVSSFLLVDTNASESSELDVFQRAGFCDCNPENQDLDWGYDMFDSETDRPDIPGLRRKSLQKWRNPGVYNSQTGEWTRSETDMARYPTFGHLFPIVPSSNPKDRRKPRKPRRIDRVYVHRGMTLSVPDLWRLEFVEPFGQEYVKDDKNRKVREKTGRDGSLFPSDHAGIWVQLTKGRLFRNVGPVPSTSETVSTKYRTVQNHDVVVTDCAD